MKTISVRPDGSVIPNGGNLPPADANPSATSVDAAGSTSPDDATMPAAAQPANPPVPVARPASINAAAAQPATPKLDLPTKLSPKSTARVPIAKIDTTVANDANPPAQPSVTPLQIVPNLIQSVAKAVVREPTTQVAVAEPVAASATQTPGSGTYSVQLAAPGTQQEAQSASTRLQAKYAGELGGLQPSIHQAELNGKSIYRVRVGSMSKADAVALCLKLKASGGDAACFVAKN